MYILRVVIGGVRSEHSSDLEAVFLVLPFAQGSQGSVQGTAPSVSRGPPIQLYNTSFLPLFQGEKMSSTETPSLEEEAGKKGCLSPLFQRSPFSLIRFHLELLQAQTVISGKTLIISGFLYK